MICSGLNHILCPTFLKTVHFIMTENVAIQILRYPKIIVFYAALELLSNDHDRRTNEYLREHAQPKYCIFLIYFAKTCTIQIIKKMRQIFKSIIFLF